MKFLEENNDFDFYCNLFDFEDNCENKNLLVGQNINLDNCINIFGEISFVFADNHNRFRYDKPTTIKWMHRLKFSSDIEGAPPK